MSFFNAKKAREATKKAIETVILKEKIYKDIEEYASKGYYEYTIQYHEKCPKSILSSLKSDGYKITEQEIYKPNPYNDYRDKFEGISYHVSWEEE